MVEDQLNMREKKLGAFGSIAVALIILCFSFLIFGVFMPGEVEHLTRSFPGGRLGMIGASMLAMGIGVFLIDYDRKHQEKERTSQEKEIRITQDMLGSGSERIAVFGEGLEEMIENRLQHVLFGSSGPNNEFVQFANGEEGIIFDLPHAKLSREQIKRYKRVAPEIFDTGVSYQVYFENEDLEKAAQFTELVFREVFSLEWNYSTEIIYGQTLEDVEGNTLTPKQIPVVLLVICAAIFLGIILFDGGSLLEAFYVSVITSAAILYVIVAYSFFRRVSKLTAVIAPFILIILLLLIVFYLQGLGVIEP